MQVGRLKYDKPSTYRNQVYIGNWFEDRCAYKKERHVPNSTYKDHYPPKPYSANNPNFIWDQKLQADGLGPRILIDHMGEKYLNNLSTMYDLSYNHFPKWFKGPIYRKLQFKLERHEPFDDYIQNYGNITNFGLMEYKKEQWRCEKPDPRITPMSHYKETFLPPKTEDLVVKRIAIPIANSSRMNKQNQDSLTLKLRGEPIYAVTPNEELVVLDREKRCNPITWECPTKEKFPVRCFLKK